PARCPTFLALSLSMLRPLPCSTLFPYTTLFRSPWTYFDQFEEDDESQTSHFVSLSSDLQLSRKTVVNASAQAGFRNETEKELTRSEEHTSELQSRENLVCRLLLEKKKQKRHEVR